MTVKDEYTILIYQTKSSRQPFTEWLNNLDVRPRSHVRSRLSRLEQGHLGDCKSVGDDVIELRIFFGPGYRIYFSFVERKVVLLLCAGDKKTQDRDIATAKKYLKDFKERT